MRVAYNAHTTYKTKNGEVKVITADFERLEIYNKELKTSVAHINLSVDGDERKLYLYHFSLEKFQIELEVREDYDAEKDENREAINRAILSIVKQFMLFILAINLKPKFIEVSDDDSNYFEFYGHILCFNEVDGVREIERDIDNSFFSEFMYKSLESLINNNISYDDLAKPAFTLKMRALTKEEIKVKEDEAKKRRANSFRPRM